VRCFELIFVGGNVIRFPVELRARPSIALVLDLAPDLQDIALTIFPVNADEQGNTLGAMSKPMIKRALAACIDARQAALLADEAGEKLAAGGYWLAPLEAAHEAQAIEAARLQIIAHEATQQAIGADRAVGFAKRGEPWRPFDVHEEAEVLFSGASRP
jgi:hypothetical protein